MSISSGVTPARSNASGPLRAAGDSVKSSHSLIVVCDVASPVPSTHTGFFGEVAGAFLGGEHDRAAAVAADAAVQLRERVGDHPRALHVVDGDRVAVVRLGIVRGVEARTTPRSRRAARSSCRTRACGGGRPSRTSRSARARTACRTAPGRGRRTTRFAPRRRAFRSARVVDPYTSTTISTWPAMIAAVACSTMNSHVEPPTPVPSTHVGRRPRYSPISIGMSRPVPLDPRPSMSSLVRPASAMARVAAW